LKNRKIDKTTTPDHICSLNLFVNDFERSYILNKLFSLGAMFAFV